MKKFDTNVQWIKYNVLKEVASLAWDNKLFDSLLDIPTRINPTKKPINRCCIYKERVIIQERVKIAIGGNKQNRNVIEVIDIACDECPVSGMEVTSACRGCLAKHCQTVCPKGAISFDANSRAVIDQEKCIECGLCTKVCPYGAIRQNKRPCESACQVGAIHMSKDKTAEIDNEKCIACGACVYQCPFGAIMDKSYILDVIDLIQRSQNNSKYKVYAAVAPSISSQFSYVKLGQVISGLKELGFHSVVEVALGADMVADLETKELVEKGFLTSSCCPAFVDFIHKFHRDMLEHVSHNLSPMAMIGKTIKEMDPSAKVIFIGPCTAKKMEFQKETVSPYIDSVLTFEELQALFDSKPFELSSLEETPLDNASYYGRIFARSGGLTDAIKEAIVENHIDDFTFKPAICSGIAEIKMAILKYKKGIDIGNFIEGMACVNGCINGAGCLTHGPKNKIEVDKYGMQAHEKTIKEAISTMP